MNSPYQVPYTREEFWARIQPYIAKYGSLNQVVKRSGLTVLKSGSQCPTIAMKTAFRLFFLEKDIWRAKSRKLRATRLFRKVDGQLVPLSNPEAELLFNEITTAYYARSQHPISIFSRITEMSCRAEVSVCQILNILKCPTADLALVPYARALRFCRIFNLNPYWLLGKNRPPHPFISPPLPVNPNMFLFASILNPSVPRKTQKILTEFRDIQQRLLAKHTVGQIARMVNLTYTAVENWAEVTTCSPNFKTRHNLKLAATYQLPNYRPLNDKKRAQEEIAYLIELGYQLPTLLITGSAKITQPEALPA